MAKQYKSQSWRNALIHTKVVIKMGYTFKEYYHKCKHFKAIAEADYNRLKTEYLIRMWKHL